MIFEHALPAGMYLTAVGLALIPIPVLEAVKEGLAAHGYRLRLDKTKARCPEAQLHAGLAAELRAELDGYAEYLEDCLPLLGKVADGEHLTIATAKRPLQGPTAKRMQAANPTTH